MGRHVVIAAVLALAVSLAAQDETPLLDDPANCTALQAPFGGAQPATNGVTTTVELATDCFLVVELQAPAGEAIELTYLSGQFDAIDVAFYEEGAQAGGAFHNPPNAVLGIPTIGEQIPGTSGAQRIFVVLQGVGGPNPGTAAIRISAGEVAEPTTTTAAETTTTGSTPSSTTEAPTTTLTTTTTTLVEESTPSTTTSTTSTTSSDPAETENTDADAAIGSVPSGNGISGRTWVLGGTILAAIGAFALAARQRSRRRPTPSPFHRSIVRWTLQHSPPSGSCSSNARAIVDPNDDGSLDGYEVSTLFALPAAGKRTRTSVGDPMLGQLETLYLGGGSGPELRSAVDALVNSLCRHLDQKRVPADSTLLAELTKSDVTLIGDGYACIDGSWRRFPDWTDVPDLPEGSVQNDVIQVAVLGSSAAESSQWLDSADELSATITELIEIRRAPIGLWVFE